MKPVTLLSRLVALSFAAAIFAAFPHRVSAQAAADPQSTAAPAPAVKADALNQAELIRTYVQMQEQLHATQLAIANNRAAVEAAARAQADSVTEKFESLNASFESERERQRMEMRHANAERADSERSTRTLLLMIGIIGAIGLLAVLLMPFVQWHAINRLAEVSSARAALPAPDRAALSLSELTAPSEQIVEQSNQRLLSVIERMERRIVELEEAAAVPTLAPPVHTTPPFVPATPESLTRTFNAQIATNDSNVFHSTRSVTAVSDHSGTIAILLGKGRLLLEGNKPKDAIICYDEILKFDANNAEALVRKGSALEQLKRDEEALVCYNLAIRSDRKKTLAYLYKGAVCSRLARHEESVESYEQALRTEEAGA